MCVMITDQSTRCTGISIYKDGKYICSEMIDMSKSQLRTDERSFEMAKAIWERIDKYKPSHLVIEDTQQQNNVKTVVTLARLQGMIIGYAEAHGVKVHILLPSKWRAILKYSQGPKVKRQELKQQSIDYVKEHYGLDLPEDICESICMGEAAHKIYNFIEDDLWGN